MKIAHCLPDRDWIDEIRGETPRDAAHIQQKYIAEGLRRCGHSLTYIAPSGLEQTVYAVDTDELGLAPQTWTSRQGFIFLSKLIWKLQQLLGIPYLNVFSNYRRSDACQQILPGHDIVLERNSLYNVAFARASSKLGLPYIMFFDADQIAELEFLGQPLKGWLLWRANSMLRENLAIARRIICVSDPAKGHLIKDWDVAVEKIIVIPNGVDVQRFRPNPGLAAEIRASLQLTNHPLVVFAGSFYRWHDVATLLKAFAIILKAQSDAHLILVGDGAEREKMINLSVGLGLERAVQFTGFVSHVQVSWYVNAADIAVVPVPEMEQKMWLSPMKLYEYMSSGKAIVASAAGQIADVIKDGHNGLLVPAGNEIALANAINKLIVDVPLRRRLGKQAREDALHNHSWEQYISCLESVLMDAVHTTMMDAAQ
jgi:glycosyltransferase involved in cell wall biosynthesis